MEHLQNVIQESLFDDMDTVMSKVDSKLEREWVEKYVKCNGNIQYLKNRTIKFGGDVLIKGFDGEVFPHHFKIANVNGDFKIEKCPNLKSIENLFVEYAGVKGEYVVANCPKLESLIGGPFKVGQNMSITSNSSLKTLDGCPMFVHNKVYVMKNGKRFNKEYIKSFITVKFDDEIFCGMEDEEANVVEGKLINEALNEPHLLQLAKQLKEKPVIQNNKSNFNTIFGHYNKMFKNTKFEVPLDQLDSSNVKEYNKIDDKTDKAIRSIISKSGVMGMILCKNMDDEYIFAINHNKQYHILNLDWGNNHRWYAPVKVEWIAMDYSQIMSMIHQYVDSCVIVSWGNEEWASYMKKINERSKLRNGLITNTPEQNEEIAKANRSRYKALANKIRAERKDEEFNKIDDAVEDIVNKVLKISREARRNLGKWKDYEISQLNEMIYGEYQSNYSSGKVYVTREAGVLSLYNSFITEYTKVKNGEDISRGDWLSFKVDQLKTRINEVQKYMSRHNM